MDYLETIRLAIISEPSNALIFLYHKLKISNTRILKLMMWRKTIILTNPEGDTSAQRSLAIAVYLEQHLTINSPSGEEKFHSRVFFWASLGTLRSNNADVVKYTEAAWGLCRGRRVRGGKF